MHHIPGVLRQQQSSLRAADHVSGEEGALFDGSAASLRKTDGTRGWAGVPPNFTRHRRGKHDELTRENKKAVFLLAAQLASQLAAQLAARRPEFSEAGGR